MITEQALNEAIAEVQGKRDPNRQDCMMLAAFYTIQDHLYPPENVKSVGGYSYSAQPETAEIRQYSERRDTVGEYGDSDFLKAISGKDAEKCWLVMDDLMNTLWAINIRLYKEVLRQIQA